MSGLQHVDWAVVAPPLAVAVGALVVLLATSFVPLRERSLATALSLLTLAVAGGLALPLWGQPRSTFCRVGAETASSALSCSLAVDRLTLVFWAVTLAGAAVVVLMATVLDRRTPPGEWHFLLLASASGGLAIAASRDLVSLVVSLEVVTLPVFAMAGLRHGDRRATEAALKLFLVGVVATAVMLMGIALVYGATGTVYLAGVNDALATAPPRLEHVATVGAVLTLAGLLFKVAAVPFHMWVPDVYAGAPLPVAAYLSVVSKAAGLVGLMLVLAYGFPSLAGTWAPLIGVLAALTMTIGNVTALWQDDAVRLLAWSSVAQVGYVLAPFAAGDVTTSALRSSVSYLAAYAVVNLCAFSVAALVGTRSRRQHLEDYRGLVRGEPGAGWPLAFALVALAGLPPGVIGLVAKVVVFDAVARPATWLAIVMAVNVAIGIVYYARWLLLLFATDEREETGSRYDVPTGLGVAIGATFAAGLLFSVLPGLLLTPLQ